VESQARLGQLYLAGLGVAPDAAEGAGWFNRAANEAHLGAMFDLAQCCEQGQGVAADAIEAYKWHSLATALGLAKAREPRDRVLRQLQGPEIAEGQRQATELFPALREKLIARRETARPLAKCLRPASADKPKAG